METPELHINTLANGAILSRVLAGMNRIRFYDTPDKTHCERSLMLAQVCRAWYQAYKSEHYSSIYVVSRKLASGRVKWFSNIPAVIAAGMESHIRNLFISGPLITSKATIVNVLQGLGFNYLELPHLTTVYFVGCTSGERFGEPSINVNKIASYFARRLPNLTRVVPTNIEEISDGVDSIVNKILLKFSTKIHTLVTGANLLGHNPDALFTNLTHVVLHNTDTFLTNRFARIAPASLKSLELLKACALFPWSMFGDDTDNEIVFPNLEELRILTLFRGMKFVPQKISQFRLRFPKLSSLYLYSVFNAFDDILDVLQQAPVRDLKLIEEATKIKNLDPTFARDLNSFYLYPDDPMSEGTLEGDCVFVKMLDHPSKMTKLTLILNTFMFPEISTVKCHNLVDVSLCFNSLVIPTLEVFLSQLPKLKSLAIRIVFSRSTKMITSTVPANQAISTSLEVLYYESQHKVPWEEFWIFSAIKRLPALSMIYIPGFYRDGVRNSIAVEKRDITLMDHIPLKLVQL